MNGKPLKPFYSGLACVIIAGYTVMGAAAAANGAIPAYEVIPSPKDASLAYTVITAPNGGDFVKVAGDLGGFITLDDSGKVYTFGDRYNPPPEDLPPIIDVAVGNFHTAALDEDGKVHAWGLLQGAFGQDFGQTDFPEDLPPIKAIAAGGYKTMLLTQDGKVLSFGSTNDGAQEHVPQLPEISAIACSAYTSAALGKDGFLYVWGIGGYGPLTKFGANIIDVAAVNYDVAYLTSDQTIHEPLDPARWSYDMPGSSFKPLADPLDTVKLAGSSGNYAAINHLGRVQVWGYYGGTYSEEAFGQVVDIPADLPPITELAFTDDSAVALGDDGKLYQWGPGRLGAGPVYAAAPLTADSPAVALPGETHPEAALPTGASEPEDAFPAAPLIIGLLALAVLLAVLLKKRADAKAKARRLAAEADRGELSETLTYLMEQIRYLRGLGEEELGDLYSPARKITAITEQIAEQLRKDPEDEKETGLFITYTLPTTIALIQSYCGLRKEPIQGNNIRASLQKIEGMMDTIQSIFNRQLDALFQKEALHIDMEIEVMKNMLSEVGNLEMSKQTGK